MPESSKPSAQEALPKASLSKALSSLLSFVWQADRWYFLIIILRAVLGSASGLLNLLLPKLLIDGFSAAWAWPRFLQAILSFGLIKYLLLQGVAFFKRQDSFHTELLQRKASLLFSQKTMRLPYQHLEDPQILDLKERAIFPITNYGALNNLLDSAISMGTGILTLGGLAALLFAFSPFFLLALLLLCGVAVLLSARFAAFMRTTSQENIPVNRKFGYWMNVATQDKHQKEFRIFGLNRVMQQKIDTYTGEIMAWLKRVHARRANNEVQQALITALMRALAYGYAALRVLGSQFGPQISLGDYSLVVLATESFFTTFMQAFLGLFNLISSVHHLMPFTQFMNLEEGQQDGTLPMEPLKTLAFEDVSFAYPGTERSILSNLSFTIKAGEKISIVGLNNAGKSTIVKLICRLFTPSAGRILWNGRDIQDYEPQAYLQGLACVFQDFFLFPFTIRDNIDPGGHAPEADIHHLLEETGLAKAIQGLPQGINTYLDKSVWEEASDFSGGEKQKLAIARSLFKGGELIILDEPTAALDPLAESEVYEHFHQLTRGKTAIFISHRMSSSTFCDRILLLQDGSLAASGSHQQLMQGHNLYRQLFLAQAQHFNAG